MDKLTSKIVRNSKSSAVSGGRSESWWRAIYKRYRTGLLLKDLAAKESVDNKQLAEGFKQRGWPVRKAGVSEEDFKKQQQDKLERPSHNEIAAVRLWKNHTPLNVIKELYNVEPEELRSIERRMKRCYISTEYM